MTQPELSLYGASWLSLLKKSLHCAARSAFWIAKQLRPCGHPCKIVHHLPQAARSRSRTPLLSPKILLGQPPPAAPRRGSTATPPSRNRSKDLWRMGTPFNLSAHTLRDFTALVQDYHFWHVPQKCVPRPATLVFSILPFLHVLHCAFLAPYTLSWAEKLPLLPSLST